MNPDEPLAYFITWTVYGTHLQGDHGGWRKRRKGYQLPESQLTKWREERLKHKVIILSPEQRAVVENECRRHCAYRGWRLWEINVRTNHVHVVITAREYSGKAVRDQLKANCTRGLREQWQELCGRPVWTAGGDWECINEVDDLETVCAYVRDAQDRMGFRNPS